MENEFPLTYSQVTDARGLCWEELTSIINWICQPQPHTDWVCVVKRDIIMAAEHLRSHISLKLSQITHVPSMHPVLSHLRAFFVLTSLCLILSPGSGLTAEKLTALSKEGMWVQADNSPFWSRQKQLGRWCASRDKPHISPRGKPWN
jgi:hypothetical protein